MNVRLATINDLGGLVRLFMMFTEESPYAQMLQPVDYGKVANMFAEIMNNNGFFVFAEKGGVAAGCFGCEPVQMIYSDKVIGRDVFAYIHPNYRGSLWFARMMEFIKREARNRGCDVLQLAAIGAKDNEYNYRLCERMGASLVGYLTVTKL